MFPRTPRPRGSRMVILVYTVAALALLWLSHRFVRALSRGAAAFLFLLPFLFVGYALVAGRVYAPIDRTYATEPLASVRLQHGIDGVHNPVTSDIYSQMIPWRHVVRESYARGDWPLWNPYILSGDILAAAAQPAPYSPFTLVALLLPAALSFTFTAAITFLVASIGAFLFARELGCRESASAIAAAGFAYSAGMALYVLWPLGLCWAIFPFVLIGARRAVREPGVRSWGLLTVALVLLLLAGHPESVLHVVALGAIYGAIELAGSPRTAVRGTATALAAGAVALLACAIYLLPILEAIPQTAEYTFREVWRANPRGDTTPQVLVSLATDVFPFLHLRAWIDPAVPGLKAETPAVGSIVLALALYAVWRIRSRATWSFAALAIFCIAAHAAWTPVARALHALPLFDIAINERLAFGGAFFLAALAALGAEEIARRRDVRAAAATFAAVTVLLAAGTVWIQRAFAIAAGPVDWGAYKVFAELAFPGLAAILFALPLPVRAALPALVALLLAQRGMSDGGVHRSFPAGAAYPPLAILEPLRNAPAPFRIVGQGSSLVPGTSALYGLEDVRGYEAMTFAPFHETYRLWCVPQTVFFNRVDDLSAPFLSLMNVRYAFADASVPVPPGWRETARHRNAVLLENENAMERAFVPHTVAFNPSRAEVVDAMVGVADWRQRAWISAGDERVEVANGPGDVSIRRAPRGYKLEARMDADGWVVVTDAAWEGWRAEAGGTPLRIAPANNAFLGIFVPKGTHTIRLFYRPASFVAGRAVSAATLAAIAAFLVARRRIRHKAAQ